MGNIVTTVKRFSCNNADAVPFWMYSSLSNATPSTRRLDKCTSDKNSSVTGENGSAINTGANGCEPVCKAVDNETMDLTTCSSSGSGCFTVSIAHTEPSGGDEEGQGKPNETIHTDAIEHVSVSCPDSSGLNCNRTSDRMYHDIENGSTKKIRSLMPVISKDHFHTVSPKENYFSEPVVAEGLINRPARNTHKYKELRLHSVSPGSSLFDHSASEELIDGNLNIGFKSIPEDSGYCEMVEFEDRAVRGSLDARGSESNPNTSLKGRAKRKRTSRKASAKMIVPTGNVGTLASPDVKYPEMVRTPLTRSKALALAALSAPTPEYQRLRSTQMGHLVVPPSDSGSRNVISDVAKLPIIPFEEQNSADRALQLPPLMIRTPLPHARSSLTPSKAKVLIVPTLETLQLRSSRSGRVIVSCLDPGTQDIIYNMDGSICGVTNSELQLPRGLSRNRNGSICAITNSELQLPRGCDSEPPVKRRRTPQCPSRYHGRSLQFDGKI